jgi:hypothetical protein
MKNKGLLKRLFGTKVVASHKFIYKGKKGNYLVGLAESPVTQIVMSDVSAKVDCFDYNPAIPEKACRKYLPYVKCPYAHQ